MVGAGGFAMNRAMSLCVLMAGVMGVAGGAWGQAGTAFTYQGELSEAGVRAEGRFDLRFRLFSDAAATTPVGPTLCADNVGVVGGRFAASLDFGSGTFDGQTRYLRVEVRRDDGRDCSSSAGFTSLDPVQEIRPAPGALVARNALSLNGLGSSFFQSAGNLTSGFLPSARLAGPYAEAIAFTNTGNQYSGSGSLLTSLNASNISAGTIGEARLPSTVVRTNRGNTFDFASTFTGTSLFTGNATFNGTASFGGTTTFPASPTFTVGATFNGPIRIPTTTRTMTLAAHAFHSTATGVDLSYSNTKILGDVAGQPVRLACPVHLPTGASITSFSSRVFDNDTVRNISVTLWRVELATDTPLIVASTATTTAGASSAIQTLVDTSISSAGIDESTYSYFLTASWTVPTTTTNVALHSVSIEYTVDKIQPY